MFMWWNKIIKGHFSVIHVLFVTLILFSNCSQKMGDEGRIRPLEPIEDEVPSARRPPPGTVSRTNFNDRSVTFTGKDESGVFAREFPIAVNDSLVGLGKKEYQIFCALCHGESGDGNGRVVRHGFTRPRPFQTQRPPGYFFYTITKGTGDMQLFGDVLNEEERWAVAAYIRNGLNSKKESAQ